MTERKIRDHSIYLAQILFILTSTAAFIATRPEYDPEGTIRHALPFYLNSRIQHFPWDGYSLTIRLDCQRFQYLGR
jgi:hypothetical protein